jgi:hypothetical protein
MERALFLPGSPAGSVCLSSPKSRLQPDPAWNLGQLKNLPGRDLKRRVVARVERGRWREQVRRFARAPMFPRKTPHFEGSGRPWPFYDSISQLAKRAS